MSFSSWADAHRRSILTFTLALALAGVAAALSLPIGLYPETIFPRLRITIDAGSQPAAQMALEVTRPIEQAVRSVPGVENITSTTSRGSGQIIADFAWGTNMTNAALQADAAIGEILPTLPPGAAFNVLRMSPNVFPFMAFALTSPTVSQIKLQTLASNQLVPLLSSVPGIARVQVQGGDTGEIEVTADPGRLSAYHLTLDDLTRALRAANSLQSVGRLEDHDQLYLLMQDNQMHGVEDVRQTVLRAGPNFVLRVRDVAEVREGPAPQFLGVDADGKRAVTLLLYRQPGADMVAIARQANQALMAFRPQIPPGVILSKWYDQSTLVLAAAGSVRDAILIGIVLAALVLLFFLRSWRITLLAITIVPASLACAILLLSLLGLSFNIMTLGGLAASVGLVIDDVIVMIEHIARRSRDGGQESGRLGVLHASVEFLRPLTGSSAATLIVFAPLGFLSGVTGAFFKALSLTMAATLFASYALTALAVPLLAGSLIDFKRWKDPSAGGDALSRLHGRLLNGVFKHPMLLALAILLLIGLGGVSGTQVQTGFMPNLDEGGFVLDYLTAPGTSLTETLREIREIEAILRRDPAVASFSMRAGAGFGGDFAEPNNGDFVIRLVPLNHRAAIDTVIGRIAGAITARVPGVDIDPHQLIGDEIGDLTGVPQPIDIELAASDPAALGPAASRVAYAISRIQGVDSVNNGITPAGDTIDIHVDQTRAAALGLDPARVAAMLQTEMAGSVATQFASGQQLIGVRVGLDGAAGLNSGELARLPIATPGGALVPLGSLASFSTQSGEPEITRENLQQVVDVTARLDGRGLGAGIADVKAALAKPGVLGLGVTYTLGGLYQQQQIAFTGLLLVFAAALVAEFILLLLLYERFLWVLVIMGSSLLSASAVFTGLYVTGIELNITAMMGMVMIVGIATEMSIFYVSEFQHLSTQMPLREALLIASANRLRPITMTTLAAILTLLPLALDLGQGAGMQQPLAVAIISGLLVQFPLVLIAMPLLLFWVSSKGGEIRAGRRSA